MNSVRISAVVAAVHDVLDRIESEGRAPSTLEDSILRMTLMLACDRLNVEADTVRGCPASLQLTMYAHGEGIRSVREWRRALRPFLH